MSERPTGVRMLRPNLDGLAPLEPVLAAWPTAYALRTYQPGDEAGWATLMNTGDMGHWGAETTQRKLTRPPERQLDPAGWVTAAHHPHRCRLLAQGREGLCDGLLLLDSKP